MIEILKFFRQTLQKYMGCKASKSASFVPGMGEMSTPDDGTRKRRAGVSAEGMSNKDMTGWKQPIHEKSATSKELLHRIISTNAKLQVLFGHLSTEQVNNVIMAMFSRDIAKGETVIKQGESGDAFWIVESGKFEIFVNRSSTNNALGDKVSTCEPGACFGELALLYNAPRAATVVATEPGRVWGIDVLSFKMMLVTAENSKKKKYESFLEKVSILSDLNAFERAALSDVIDVATFSAGEIIMKQGDRGNNFYILESGQARAFIATDSSEEVLAKEYTESGEYFGELALLLATPRKATVYAGTAGCVLLYVSKDKFDRILGPIKHRLKVEQYPEYADIIMAKDEKLEQESSTDSPTSQ